VQTLWLLLLSSLLPAGVTHVAVKPWKDANGCYRLAAYVAPDSVDLAAAEAHCRAKLLPAMVSANAEDWVFCWHVMWLMMGCMVPKKYNGLGSVCCNVECLCISG
jgi:hypothetical protein